MSRGRVQTLAIGGALAVFLLLLLALRLRSWLPFVGAALVYLGLLWALRPRLGTAPPQVTLPDGVATEDYRAAIGALDEACRQLETLAVEAQPADAPMIERMARLVAAIRGHHLANPGHVPRSRAFLRHTLGRMVAAVAGYLDLVRRAGPAAGNSPGDSPGECLGDSPGNGPGLDPRNGREDDRLAVIRRRLEGFVPVLERIDRACIDDDLTALEINVEVLDEQLGRGDRGNDATRRDRP